jgi:cleavage and polyadenylation specificity factor subunit 1
MKNPMEAELVSLEAQFDSLLLASKLRESIIYRIGDVFEELRGTEFNRSGPTLAAGVLLGGALFAQVVPGEIRVYDNGNSQLEKPNVGVRVHQLIPITDEEFGQNCSIRSALVCDPWMLLVLDNGRAVVYTIDGKTKDIDVHSELSKIEVNRPGVS